MTFREFPSPFGAYLFQMDTEDTRQPTKHGFRPLSGPIYFKFSYMTTYNNIILFPSPFGAYLFQIITEIVGTVREKSFPSPFGAYLFQMDMEEMTKEEMQRFRPLSGPIYFKFMHCPFNWL